MNQLTSRVGYYAGQSVFLVGHRKMIYSGFNPNYRGEVLTKCPGRLHFREPTLRGIWISTMCIEESKFGY